MIGSTNNDEGRPMIQNEVITFEFSERNKNEITPKAEKDDKLLVERSDTVKPAMPSRTCLGEEDNEIDEEGTRPIMEVKIRDSIMK